MVACARYRVDDEREKALLLRRPDHGVTHVLFIVNLPRKESEMRKIGSKTVGFQGGHWVSAHIDDIRQPCREELTLEEARNASISELFYNKDFISSTPSTKSDKVIIQESGASLEGNGQPLDVDETMQEEEIEILDEEMNEEDVSVSEAIPMEVESKGILLELAEEEVLAIVKIMFFL